MNAPKSVLRAAEVRRRFVEYFVQRGHTHVPSSSLVPRNDPTLLFVNAGMNQFKDVFTGREQRPYDRAVTVQRCLRAGGKHNDLDNVGFTPRHQTLFEMLGNFSFGDYFKTDAIAWGWEFLTSELGIPGEALAVTVFDGTGEAAPPDEEALELWARFVPRERIYRCSAKDNFWAMGDQGPCGPCSEIHIYRDGPAPPDAGQPGKGPAFEDDRYLELWNLVFMQYDKRDDGQLVALPKPSIDTGAGLERIVATLQGAASNYETDLLEPLCELAKRLAGDQRAGTSEAPFRVIADHARATAFLIADGVFPDNAGRSYVLRRIMRRAIRHGTEVGLDRPFFHHVCSKVVELFGDVYPELAERAATIDQVVQGEEEAFRRTLDRGLRRLHVAIAQNSSASAFDPEVAAELYDTYGFPIDLTGVIAAERGLRLDEAAADAALKARQSGGGRGAELGGEAAVADVYFELATEVGETAFVGYETLDAETEISAIVSGESRVRVERADADSAAVEVIVERTAMYGESGGQVGDRGIMETPTGRLEVLDTQKPVPGLVVHRGRIETGVLRVGQTARVVVDHERRAAVARNHSATHLLHLALRLELGDHVVQKGSLVTPDRLRFDYSHNRPLGPDQRRSIEARVVGWVLANVASVTEELTPEQAKRAGAIGLFEAKYGEAVRVIRIGGESLELCGGTHVRRSGDIGSFAIVNDASIAAGVRRIEAVTGFGALRYVQALAEATSSVMGQLHASTLDELCPRIDRLHADLRAKDHEIQKLTQKLVTGGAASDAEDVVDVDGIKLLTRRVTVSNGKALRAASDALRDRMGSGVVVLGADTEGKATLLVAVTKDLIGRIHAGNLVGALARHVDGRGGGRPDLAQAGGPNAAGLERALEAAEPALREQMRPS